VELLAFIIALLSLVLLGILLWRSLRSGSGGIEGALREELRLTREESSRAAKDLREEVTTQLKATTDTLVKAVSELGSTQEKRLDSVTGSIKDLTEKNEIRLEKIQQALDSKIEKLQESNEKKLDQMRATVDEKLQSTLEKRLSESFKLVSTNLEAVLKGLGEMQNLATGVGDLKRVLTNVKARGTFGEVQLANILEEILTPEQYASNVQLKEDTRELVEFAIKLPGKDSSQDSVVWLPIDAKFPQEDYLRLLEASESGNSEAMEAASTALIRALHVSAKDIQDKYINPPVTTDFAILFLPTEGLYAEVLRKAGQVEELQRKFRIVVAGPTTLAALLSSLRMGFRTLAIEKRSSEVWQVLAAVKTEFGKFGDVLGKVKKQLDTASTTIEKTGVRTRAMARKLRTVEELPTQEAQDLLGLIDEGEAEITDETEGDEIEE